MEPTPEIELHPAQMKFHLSKALYRGFVGGRGAGKSWIGAFDLIARAKAGRTYLVASPTYPMLNDSSLRSFLYVARMLGVLDPKQLKKAPPPACVLRTGAEILFRSTDDPERLRGPNLSGVWLDEASLMSKDALDIVIACLREGGEQGWLPATFTPKGVGHWTYDQFGKPRPDTELFHARTRDNPFNPPEFAETLLEQYGDSGFAQQELSGQFVDFDDAFQLIPTYWVRAAQARWAEKPPEGQALTALGVDVAYGGADSTVIVRRFGNWFDKPRKFQGVATDSGQKAAFKVLEAHSGTAHVNVDVIGYGASCFEYVKEKLGSLARPINVSKAPIPVVWDRSHKYKLVNVRAAMYWRLREALDPDYGEDLMLPPGDEVLGDLTAPRFEPRGNGIVIESKEDIKERLRRSPDVGDAIALALWEGQGFRYKIAGLGPEEKPRPEYVGPYRETLEF